MILVMYDNVSICNRCLWIRVPGTMIFLGVYWRVYVNMYTDLAASTIISLGYLLQ